MIKYSVLFLMPHLPYHKYIGPGTNNFKEIPIDQDDAIAREHDLAYQNAKTDDDIFKADKSGRNEFFTDWIHNKNYHSLIGGLGLSFKNTVEQNVLNKSIYGMPPPPKKNWAAIRRINQRRAAARERNNPTRAEDRAAVDIRGHGHQPHRDIEPDAEINFDDLPDFLQETIDSENANVGGSGSQTPPDNQIEEPPTKQQKMDDQVPTTSTDTGGAPVDTRTGGQAAGGMGAGGAANDGRQDIFRGAVQPNQYQELNYSKSYHITLTNGLPDFRHFFSPSNTYNSPYEAQQRFKNIHGIPWELLTMYMSNGEILRMFRDYTTCKVIEVCCEVFSLGVRLPFVTSATTSTVANANAQYPIGKFSFDNHYKTYYDRDNVTDFINKIQGAQWMNTIPPNPPVTTTWSENFPNITAGATSRDVNNPVIVSYPLPFTENNSQRDVGIYDHVDIKNGTTAYGKCWEQCFYPTNGILYAESTLVGSALANQTRTSRQIYTTPIPGLHDGYFISDDQVLENSLNYSNNAPRAFTSTKNDFTNLSLSGLQADYNGIHTFGDRKAAPVCMPKFMIGFVNIRNEDNSLLSAKWDVLLRCSIKLVGMQATRDFISRNIQIPPQWFTSQYQQFRQFNINGSRLAPDSDIRAQPTKRRAMTWLITQQPFASDDNEKKKADEEVVATLKKLRHKSYISITKK